MSRRSPLVPTLVVLVLVSASPALPQAGRHAGSAAPASWTEALRSVLPKFLVRFSGDEGCGADPYGRARNSQTKSYRSNRSLISIWSEEGCGLDPYGRCLGQFSAQPSGH